MITFQAGRLLISGRQKLERRLEYLCHRPHELTDSVNACKAGSSHREVQSSKVHEEAGSMASNMDLWVKSCPRCGDIK